ncbi:relaxase domain-containing protein [Paeniroseomonas aquatica]|uniref:relaxase domain-containing protein n=1 Tax=Paeniroseomonas aquatica TaxID=373043 RepID=UPI00360A1DF7
MAVTTRDDDRLARLEERQDALLRGVAQMNETLATHTAMLERILVAAAEEPDESDLGEALRRIAEALAAQEVVLDRLDGRLAALPGRLPRPWYLGPERTRAMLTYSTIAAGTPADAQAMTNHLLTQTLPREVADLARYYTRGMAAGSAEDHDVAKETGLGERLAQAVQRRDFDEAYGAPVAEPRRDMHPLVVRGLGLDPNRGVTRDEINALLAGRRADGGKIEGKHYAVARTVTDRRSGEAKDLVPIGSVDFCLTPDKSVSVAWAFARPAEQAAIYGAHHDAAAEAMAYVETRIGQARKGMAAVRVPTPAMSAGSPSTTTPPARPSGPRARRATAPSPRASR